jgi:hypothetical protein
LRRLQLQEEHDAKQKQLMENDTHVQLVSLEQKLRQQLQQNFTVTEVCVCV